MEKENKYVVPQVEILSAQVEKGFVSTIVPLPDDDDGFFGNYF